MPLLREVMSGKQASEYLGISRATLYRYATQNKVPTFKRGNRWKFKKSILDEWIERKLNRRKISSRS